MFDFPTHTWKSCFTFLFASRWKVNIQQYSILHTRIVLSYLESCSLRVMQEMTKEAYYESNLNISFVYTIITAIHNTVAPLWSTLNIHSHRGNWSWTIRETNVENNELVKGCEGSLLVHTRKLICKNDKARQPKKKKSNSENMVGEENCKHRDCDMIISRHERVRVLPSNSAPSSTSPIRSFPADDSSSNSDSVLRSNARFSMPPLVGVLDRQIKSGE